MRPAERAKEIFLEAVELPAERRGEFVADACAGDADLEQRVLRLLGAHVRSDELIDVGELRQEALATGGFQEELEPGATIGAYELTEQIGEGGFGSVWRAEQHEPVKRPVALKVLKAGVDTREVVARFEAERQALARMDHPCIARVYDAGTTERGRPWFAMELVLGEEITRFCERKALRTRERIELFVDVCRAVQHAHQKGVIHRDLKPPNVLVTEVDGRAVPKVIDFGIAKATQGTLTDSTLRTRVGQMVGTPTYMSPEQVDGSDDIDTRTDVYSLGVLLYEVLSGVPPFDPRELVSGGLGEMARVIREVDPPKPSTRLVHRAEGTGPTRVEPRHLRGDLDWIVMRCLEKDRERRYDSAAVLTNELQRYLNGEPVLAGPPHLAYRLRKLGRRHRTSILVAAAVAVSLVAGLVTTTQQMVRARRAEKEASTELVRAQRAERTASRELDRALRAEELASTEADRARTELQRSRAVSDFLEHLLLSIDPEIARDKDTELLAQILGTASTTIAGGAEGLPEVEATLRRIIGGAYFQIAHYDEAEAHLRRALTLRTQVLGPEDPATLASAEELGALYVATERHEEAEELLVPTRAAAIELEGEDGELALRLTSHLAVLRRKERRFEESEELTRHLLDTYAERFGEAHDKTIREINNLGVLLSDMGRDAEALEQHERAYALNLELHGELHPNTLYSGNNLADAYLQLGEHARAIPVLRQVLDGKRRIFPEGHPSLVIGLNGLAMALKGEERFEEALEVFDEALVMARAHLGSDAAPTGTLLLNRGRLALDLDRVDEAEANLTEALSVLRETRGDRHPATLMTESSLADTLWRLEREDEALELARHAFEGGRATYGPRDTNTGAFGIVLGRVLVQVERYDEALLVLKECNSIVRMAGEPSLQRRAVQTICEIYERQGDFEEADRWRLPE